MWSFGCLTFSFAKKLVLDSVLDACFGCVLCSAYLLRTEDLFEFFDWLSLASVLSAYCEL